jgi:hypothetical protein
MSSIEHRIFSDISANISVTTSRVYIFRTDWHTAKFAADSHRHSNSWFQVPRNPWPYFKFRSLQTLATTDIHRMFLEERSIFWEVIVSAILSQKIYMYMCPTLKGFRDRAISLYSSKIVAKKEILRIFSNTGIYCPSDKVGTVYLV